MRTLAGAIIILAASICLHSYIRDEARALVGAVIGRLGFIILALGIATERPRKE